MNLLKFRFSKKATKFDLTFKYLANVKSSGRLFQIFVAFSDYPNFTTEEFCARNE